tara:strand:+ start:166 stop:417 length:252 start_codon:yes stop_codon:yes gene_type:complete
MPRNSWFKKLWRWKFGPRSSVPKKTLKRTNRFESFRRVNNGATCFDSEGKDISHLVRHSFVYDGVPGGYYLDRSHNPLFISTY